jgi:hypothetical protein
MTTEQVAAWAAEIERVAEELAANAHALIIQTRQIQREFEKPELPEQYGMEGTD